MSSSSSATLKVVVGVGGGIAAYKSCGLIRALKEQGHHVTVVPTVDALRFVGSVTFEALSGNPVATSVFDEVASVQHVRLGQEADLVVIAPATADLMSRLAAGRTDDLLTATVLTATCPVVVAPAMHTEMWHHPATQRNVATLREDGVLVMEPGVGRLTGKDTGPGRLLEPEDIAQVCEYSLESTQRVPRDLVGRKIVISTGGTREDIDPVRYLANRSSGKQGVALAVAAACRGANVQLVAGSIDIDVPTNIPVVSVRSARDMHAAMLNASVDADAVIMAAAVADFRPEHVADTKLKKGSDSEPDHVKLVRNPDILADLVSDRKRGGIPVDCMVVGFAAETGDDHSDACTYGREKIQRKGCDLLVVNEVGTDLTFGADDNSGWILSPDGSHSNIPRGSKLAFAHEVLNAMHAGLTPLKL